MTLRDNFNRADGALGSDWTALVGTNPYSIISNVAACNGASAENCTIYNAFTPGNDQWAEVTITQIQPDTYVGPAVRASGTSWYVFYGDNANRALYRIVSGTPTVLASTATGFAVNDVIRLEAEGTTLRCYVNGTLWNTVTDSSLSSGSVGMATWSTSNQGRVDNFTADNLTTSVTVTPGPATTTATAPAPTVVLGSVTITPAAQATATATAPAPTVLAGGTPQYARPASDVSIGAWTTESGGTSNLYAAIDETSANDADYIRSELSPSTSLCTIALGSLTDPVSSSGHVVRYRYGKDPTDSAQINLTVRLRQGATLIAEWTHTNISTTLTTAAQTLSGTEADSITDYADLRIQFEASQV